jgi:hypothetical protein
MFEQQRITERLAVDAKQALVNDIKRANPLLSPRQVFNVLASNVIKDKDGQELVFGINSGINSAARPVCKAYGLEKYHWNRIWRVRQGLPDDEFKYEKYILTNEMANDILGKVGAHLVWSDRVITEKEARLETRNRGKEPPPHSGEDDEDDEDPEKWWFFSSRQCSPNCYYCEDGKCPRCQAFYKFVRTAANGDTDDNWHRTLLDRWARKPQASIA